MNDGRAVGRAARRAFLAALVLLTGAPGALAVGSQTWRLRERADFERGEPKGVSLAADGALRLSPRLDRLYETSQPYVWALAEDGRGTIYASGGNEGIVYRIDSTGKGEVFFRAEEPEVHALALGADGALYAAGSPGGRIYKIAPDGTATWTAETGEKYVWALAFDRQGSLYAATGIEGRVLKIDASGKSRILFDSAETHIRCLALDAEGNLLAGTDGHGLVFRIDREGTATVLYDAPLNEVVSLVPGPGGAIYAAVVGEPRGGARPSPPPSGATSGPVSPSDAGGAPGQTPSPQPPPETIVLVPMEGRVLLISPDGYGREVWSGSQEAILSLEVTGGGDLLMGSSQQGKVYALAPDLTVSEIARADSSQVTVLLRRGGGRGTGESGRPPGRKGRGPAPAAAAQAPGPASDVLVGGSNLGVIATLHPGFAASGIYESRVLDARSISTWGRVAWRADAPRGTRVVLKVRSGNTEEPDRTWSPWGADLADEQGVLANCPPARFLQWQAVLASDEPSRTPQLREVAVTYLQRNLPPEIRKVEVQAPGVALQKVPPSPPGQGTEGKPAAGPGEAEGGARRKPRPTSRRYYEPGARSVSWQAADPNDDELAYDVSYRAVDETAWKPIRTRIDEDFVTLDSTAIPDGTYVVRLVASDAPSNPTSQALTTEKVSERFDVDNTPPRVEEIRAEARSATVALTFTVRDTFSIVREVAYAVDAGEWMPAGPDDGLNDSPVESFRLTIPALSPGEHSIVIRAADSAGNVGAGKAVVQVP